MRSSARAAAHSGPRSPAARINQREVGPSTAILSLLMLQLARQNADALPRLKPLVFAVALFQGKKLLVCGHRLRLPPQFIVAGSADEPRTCAGRFTPVELVEYLERGLIALAEIVHRHQVAQCVCPVAIELQGLPQFALGGSEIPLLEPHAAHSRVHFGIPRRQPERFLQDFAGLRPLLLLEANFSARSEERRVGKEGGEWGA